MHRVLVAKETDVVEGKPIKFEFDRDGKPREGFAFRLKGELFAYENVCRHLPVSLDYGDGEFFTRDGKMLICQNHAAIFEPETGLCTRGPCRGESLFSLKLETSTGQIWLLLD